MAVQTERKISDIKEPVTRRYPFLSVIAATNITALAAKKTSECFTGSRWGYRHDTDLLIKADQPETDACTITTLISSELLIPIVVARIILNDTYFNESVLKERLISHGHTMTLAQAEEMVEVTERGEKTGMRGRNGLFFVETGDENNSVAIGRITRGGDTWGAYVFSDKSFDLPWDGNDHGFLIRNLTLTFPVFPF